MSWRRFVVLAALSALGMLALPGSAAAETPIPPYPTCSPEPADCTRWHAAAVVTVAWAQPPPGVTVTAGCGTSTVTSDTPVTGALLLCSWWTLEGGTASREIPVRRDATPPSALAAPDRGPDSNGWYNKQLSVDFTGSDAHSGLAGCSPARTYSGPETGVASVIGTCTDRAGNVRSGVFTFQYDSTPPTVTPEPARKPDRKGWYNHEVTVGFRGADGTSGIHSCAPDVTYAGPESSKTAVSGACTDRAGNASSAAAYELRFDSRPPVLSRVKADPQKKHVALRWVASDDATSFAVLRRPGLHGARWSTVYSGTKEAFVDASVAEGVRYRYTVTAYDEAGNADVGGVRVRAAVDDTAAVSRRSATPALRSPLDGARVPSRPLLSWTTVPKATYYNVQLFRVGKKVLSAWPTRASLRLRQSWKFESRTHRLSPGRYRWFVWPGFGQRTASRYGKLLGTRTFVVTR